MASRRQEIAQVCLQYEVRVAIAVRGVHPCADAGEKERRDLRDVNRSIELHNIIYIVYI